MANNLLEQHEQLRNQERKLTIAMKSHEDKAEDIAQGFRTTVKCLNSTTRVIDYLRCLETLLKQRYCIENCNRTIVDNSLFNCSSALEKFLSTGSLNESLSVYSQIANLTELVRDTSTEHLRSYSADLTLYWYNRLKSVLAS